MRKLLALLLISLTACGEPATPPTNLAAARVNAYNATVIMLDPSDEYAMCSGEFIAPNQIVTAAHCLEPYDAGVGDTLSYVTFDGLAKADLTPSLATVHAVDAKLDVVVLSALEPSKTWVSIGGRPVLGDTVFSLGHPKGKLYTEARGFVLRCDDEFITALVPVNFGSSGGGLYNTQFELVGVTLRMYAGGNVAVFANAEQLRHLMQ